MEELLKKPLTVDQFFELVPEYDRAYDIHGQHYEGEEVSDEDQVFYNQFMQKMLTMMDEYWLPMSILLWLIYAGKYVTGTGGTNGH